MLPGDKELKEDWRHVLDYLVKEVFLLSYLGDLSYLGYLNEIQVGGIPKFLDLLLTR